MSKTQQPARSNVSSRIRRCLPAILLALAACGGGDPEPTPSQGGTANPTVIGSPDDLSAEEGDSDANAPPVGSQPDLPTDEGTWDDTSPEPDSDRKQALVARGQETKPDSWTSFLRLDGAYHCMANLVDTGVGELWFVTAAHCLVDVNGRHIATERITVCVNHIRRSGCRKPMRVEFLYAHPDYRNGQNDTPDIGLVRAIRNDNWRDFSNGLKLPTKDTQTSGKWYYIKGFGLTSPTSKPADLLQGVWMQSEGFVHLPGGLPPAWFPCKAQFYCLRVKDAGLCGGDSGAAMVEWGHYLWPSKLLGVVSKGAGERCGISLTTKFTKIYPHVDWIKSTAKWVDDPQGRLGN